MSPKCHGSSTQSLRAHVQFELGGLFFVGYLGTSMVIIPKSLVHPAQTAWPWGLNVCQKVAQNDPFFKWMPIQNLKGCQYLSFSVSFYLSYQDGSFGKRINSMSLIRWAYFRFLFRPFPFPVCGFWRFSRLGCVAAKNVRVTTPHKSTKIYNFCFLTKIPRLPV